MKFTRNTQRGTWLLDRVGDWASVGGVAGTGFEAYARILHPVRARRFGDDIDEWGSPRIAEEARWGWARVAERNGRVMHPLVQWRRLTDDETALSFTDGWEVSQSEEGRLAPELLAALTRHLAAATTTPDDVTAGVWNGWGELHDGGSSAYIVFGVDEAEAKRERARLAAEARASVAPEVRKAVSRGPWLQWPGREFLLFDTSLAELSDPNWMRGAGLGATNDDDGVMPQLLWPADQSWVVASEIDWDSTIVAGSRGLIDAVLADPALEAFEVDEDADLSWDGDIVNR
jgi:hypothetical protein